ncbi:MAG: hypothetical protein K2J67_00650 [Lachnospiraceae bacterium]|nr:hypothetical protein [Lachnospiraceae bacterium]
MMKAKAARAATITVKANGIRKEMERSSETVDTWQIMEFRRCQDKKIVTISMK